MGSQDEVPTELQIVLYAVVGTISLICNSLIFLVIGTNKVMRTKSNLMLLSLATTDWMIIVTGVPIHLINLIKGGNQTKGVLCKFFGFLVLVPFMVSIFNITLIAVHRYVMVVKNKHYRRLFSDRNTYLAIASVWLIGTLISIPPLLGWGNFEYNANRSHCMIDWIHSLSYLIFIQILAYPAPMVTMCFCYYKILRHSYDSTKRLASSSDKRQVAKKKREMRLSIMLLLVLCTFFLLFMPYACLIIYEGMAQETPSHTFSFIALLSAYSNSMVDFWIYAALNTKFRQALTKMFYKVVGKIDSSSVSQSIQDSSSDANPPKSRCTPKSRRSAKIPNSSIKENELTSNTYFSTAIQEVE